MVVKAQTLDSCKMEGHNPNKSNISHQTWKYSRIFGRLSRHVVVCHRFKYSLAPISSLKRQWPLHSVAFWRWFIFEYRGHERLRQLHKYSKHIGQILIQPGASVHTVRLLTIRQPWQERYTAGWEIYDNQSSSGMGNATIDGRRVPRVS